MALIDVRVRAARVGSNHAVIGRMRSGWAVVGDVQFLRGYCLLLADPVVPDINTLNAEDRASFLADMVRIGDAVLSVTGCSRINYEILGNSEPELHAHIFPRYASEPDVRRRAPVWGYFTDGIAGAHPFELTKHGDLLAALRAQLFSAP